MENNKKILEEIARISFITNYDPSKVVSEQKVKKGGFTIGGQFGEKDFNIRGRQRSASTAALSFDYEKELDKGLDTAGDVLSKMLNELDDEIFKKLTPETKNMFAEGFYNAIEGLIAGQKVNKEDKDAVKKIRKFFKKSQRWQFTTQALPEEVETVKVSVNSTGDISTLEELNKVMVNEVYGLNESNSQTGTILSKQGSYFYFDKKEKDVSSNVVNKPVLSAIFAAASKPLTTKELSPEDKYATFASFDVVIPRIPGTYTEGSSDPKGFLSGMMKTILEKVYSTSVSFNDGDPEITVKEMIECGENNCDSQYKINVVGASIISSASNTWVNGEKLDFTHENNGKKIKDISGISNKGNNSKNLKLAKERANKLIQTVLTDVSKTPGIKLSTSFDWSSDIDMEIRITDTGGQIDKTRTAEFPNPGQYSEIVLEFSVSKFKEKTISASNQLKGEIQQKLIVLKYVGKQGGGFDIDLDIELGFKNESLYLRKGLFGGHLKHLSDDTTNRRRDKQDRTRQRDFDRKAKENNRDRFR